MREKIWWRVMRRDEHGKIRDGCRQLAFSRKAAKEQAAKQWGLTETSQLTAISDRSSYNIPEEN